MSLPSPDLDEDCPRPPCPPLYVERPKKNGLGATTPTSGENNNIHGPSHPQPSGT